MSSRIRAFVAVLALLALGIVSAQADYEEVFVWQTNYSQGLLSTIDPADGSTNDLSLTFYQDSKLATWGEYLFVIERLNADAITVLDPANPATPLANYSVGNQTNPYGILPISESKAYVIRYEVANVLIVNTMTGDSIGTVDLSPYADADGIPEMGEAVLVDTTLYVALQLLDRTTWAPSTEGLLVAIGTNSNTVVDTTSLTIENPLSMTVNDAGTALFVGGGRYLSFSATPDTDILGAGVDRVSLEDLSVERVLNGSEVNGNIGTVGMAPGDSILWVLAVEQTWPNASVTPLYLENDSLGSALADPVAPSSFVINDDGKMAVIDRDMTDAGVYGYDAATGEKAVDRIAMTITPDHAVFAATNRAPRFDDAGTLAATEGVEFSTSFSATDEESDAITLSAVTVPPGAVFEPSTGTFTWTPGFFDGGEQEIVLRAADEKSSRDVTFTISVAEGTPANHQESIFVYMTDYVQGLLGTYVVGHSGVTNLNLPLHSDVAMDTWGGGLFLIERLNADDVVLIDPANAETPVANYSLGNQTNPYGVEVLNEDVAYAIRYGSAEILVFDPEDGTELGTIDLTAYADEDNIPEMGEAVLVDTTLYVALQLLTNYSPSRTGLLVAISTHTNAVIDTVSLTIKNPLSMDVTTDGSALLIGGGQYLGFGPADAVDYAGVDRVELPSLAVSRIVEGSAISGNVGSLVCTPNDSTAWLVASEATYPNATVYQFDAESGEIITTLSDPVAPSALAVSLSGNLLVIDRDYAGANFRVYDAKTANLVQNPVSTTLAPDKAIFVTHNDNPTWDHQATMDAKEAVELEFTVTVDDEDGDDIEVVALELPEGAEFNKATKTFSWTPGPVAAGLHRVTFRVSDGITDVIYPVTIDVEDDPVPVDHPEQFVTALMPAAPNPFNPQTQLRFSVAEAGQVEIVVYDIMGQPIRTLVSDVRQAGFHTVTWNGRDAVGRAVASGIYITRMHTANTVLTQRMTLVR